MTGVQTCALPIFEAFIRVSDDALRIQRELSDAVSGEQASRRDG